MQAYWDIRDGYLTVKTPRIVLTWKVPSDFEIPCQAIRDLAIWVLFRVHDPKIKAWESDAERAPGDPSRIGLAFSGGEDSIAATHLLPSVIPFLMKYERERPEYFVKATRAIRHFDPYQVVTTNAFEIGKVYDHPGRQRTGMWGQTVFAIGAVIFADYYNLGTIATGDIGEAIYQSSSFNTINHEIFKQRYRQAGLQLALPVAGLTEVSTSKICSLSPMSRLAQCCLKGPAGIPCGRCYKCFRKSMLRGDSWRVKFVSSMGIPVTSTLLWLVKHKGLRHPDLERLAEELDGSWADKWLIDSLRFIPDHLKSTVIERVQNYNIEMIGGNPYAIWPIHKTVKLCDFLPRRLLKQTTRPDPLQEIA